MSKKYILVNAITTLRIICAGIILFAALEHRWALALISTLVAFVSDYADGKLARNWNVSSSFGAFFDPLADKVVCLLLLWLFAFHYHAPLYIVIAGIISIYDVTTTTLRLIHTKRRPLSTSHIAKLKTAVLMAGLLWALIGIATKQQPWVDAGIVFLSTAALLTAISLNRYLRAVAADQTQVEQHQKLGDINFTSWRQKHKITCILFDIEGTLTPWADQRVADEIMRALATAKAAGVRHFGLVSNMNIRHEARARAVAEQIGAKIYELPEERSQRKPRSYMIKRALKELNMSPLQTAFVGDKLVDVIAARRAGLTYVAWVQRLGTADHPFDRVFYRPFEPILKWLSS